MKNYLVICVIVLFGCQSFAQETPDSSKTLKEIVITEKYLASFEGEKFPVILKTDFSDIIQIPEQVFWSSLNVKDQFSAQDNWDMFYFNFSSPEQTNIHPQPAKVFHARFKNLVKWGLQIYSSDGRLFRTIEGKKNPPPSLVWDGFGNDGTMLIPGLNYSYSFTATDKAGNKKTFPGETFSIPALFITLGDSLWIGIAESKLFSADGFGLLNSAHDYSKEISSLIRYYSKKSKISFESSHPQKDKFLNLLVLGLNSDLSCFDLKTPSRENQNCIIIRVE